MSSAGRFRRAFSHRAREYGSVFRHLVLPTSKRVVQFLCAAHLFREVAYDMVPCSGSSMLPSLAIDGDVIIHSPMAYWRSLIPWGPRFVMPQRGELVVAVNPNEFRGTVCKRVVGLPGDIVEFDPRRGGVTWSAGSLVPQLEADKRKEKDLTFVKVPKGHVWLSGDNMSNSTDSRDYGPMPIAMIRGKVIKVISGFSFKEPLVTTVTELGPSPEPPRASSSSSSSRNSCPV